MKNPLAISVLFVRVLIHGTFLTVLYLISVMVSAMVLNELPLLNMPGAPLAVTILVSVTLYCGALLLSAKAGYNVLSLDTVVMVLLVAIFSLLIEPFLLLPVKSVTVFGMDHIINVWPTLTVTALICLIINFIYFRSSD